MPRYTWILMSLLALTACLTKGVVGDDDDDSSAVSGSNQAVQDLKSLIQANGGIADLNDEVFSRLVLEQNRPYGLYVLFNARDKRFNCDVCGPFEEELRLVANSYRRMKDKDEEGKLPLLFFAAADWGPNQRSFNQYNIKAVPKLVYFDPTEDSPHKQSQFPHPPMRIAELTAEAITEYVKDTSGVNIEIYRSPVPKLIGLLTLLVVFAIALRYASEKLWKIAMVICSFKPLWVAASLFIVFISVSGVLFDIIRGVPWVGMNPQTRKVEWYTTQSGLQYGMEGFVIGCLNMACAVCMVVLAQYLPHTKRESQFTVAIAMVVLFAFCYTRICSLYRMKNPWYFSGLGFM